MLIKKIEDFFEKHAEEIGGKYLFRIWIILFLLTVLTFILDYMI